MKAIKIQPSDDIGEMQVPLKIELTFATSAKMNDIPILEQVLARAIEDVQKRFAKDSYVVYVGVGAVRPMTQEELLQIIPRKVHMAEGDGTSWRCTTAHVSQKNLTGNPEEVTCKLCLRAMGGKLGGSGTRGR